MSRAALSHPRVFTDPEFAGDYARRHERMAQNLGARYAKRLAQMGFQRGAILDAGCGFGGVVMSLEQAFPDAQVVGTDLSEPLLERARVFAQAAGLTDRVRFELADVEQLPFTDGEFDVVINTNMVHIVEQPVQMLNEMDRVLAADGCLFIADIRRSWVGLVEKVFRSGLSVEEARDLIGRSGIRPGVLTSDLLWWRYEALPQES